MEEEKKSSETPEIEMTIEDCRDYASIARYREYMKKKYPEKDWDDEDLERFINTRWVL